MDRKYTYTQLSQEPDAAYVAELATRSLLYEVSVSPKPGLVDRFDSGAHSDMDFFTFLDSTAALTEYFRSTFLLSRDAHEKEPEAVFHLLRQLGLCAERIMYQATGGINTHKGIIFTLGLLCGGLGWLCGNQMKFDATQLLSLCSEMVKPTMTRELVQIQSASATTGGERYFAMTGCGGIRAEAADGYPSIRTCSLPALQQALKGGYSYNDAGIVVLLKLLCCVQDSNIFARCGAEWQMRLAEEARNILSSDTLDFEKLKLLNHHCIQAHASPGGCADLLAATFFLYFYFGD